MNPKRPDVLLIEDNAADVNLVEEALAEAQVDCGLHIVPDGFLAIEFMDQLDADPSRTAPDIVLLDLNLPKVGGETVLKRVRLSPKCGSSKILILSSSDAPRDREHALKLGANEYFRKPSELEAFMMLGPKIRAMLETKATS